MKQLFTLILLSVLSSQVFSAEVSLSDETIIITQMISSPEVQKCIKQIENEYQGSFHIWQIVRRPLNPDATYEEGSAALAAHSTYFFRGTVGAPNYSGPDAVAVDTVGSSYTCLIVDRMYN